MNAELQTSFFNKPSNGQWQAPADALPAEVWDVLVVGAGPAGSTAAFQLAARGHRVLLIDEAPFPREKICGGALTADALHYLDRLGLGGAVRALGLELDALSLISCSGIEARLDGDFVTLERRVLDALLARHAVAAGAVFARGRIERATSEPDGSIALTTSNGVPLRARVGILATGARVRLARGLGLVTRTRPTGMAVRCLVRSTVRLRRHVICCDTSVFLPGRRWRVPGFAWIFPLSDEHYNIGYGILRRNREAGHESLRECFERFVNRFGPAHELIERGTVVSPPRSGILRTGLRGTRRMGDGNLLLAGETIGSTLPFTGAGVGTAMETAGIAAEVVGQALEVGDMRLLRDYPHRIERRLRIRAAGYRCVEALFANGVFNDLAVRLARRSRMVRRLLADLLMDGRTEHGRRTRRRIGEETELRRPTAH